jgi:TetR/AcrR family transcriptional regulator, repressor for uid operon
MVATARDTRRLRTRERILTAAFTVLRETGLAGAEIRAIVAAAGVAHGTFFVHFPTKEHVLVELEQREETRMAGELARFLARPHRLADALDEIVRLVADLRARVGDVLFKELLAAHFSPTRPSPDAWTDHPVIVLLVRELEQARDEGALHPEVDAFYSASFFLLGVYGAFTAPDDGTDRLPKLVAATVRGLETR